MANPTKEERSRGCQSQGQFKISSLGWLCVWNRGEWIAVLKLSDEQMQEYRTWKEIGIK